MLQELEIQAVIGFTGKITQGLILHPDNEHIIYQLGSTIVIRHIIRRAQTFLRGHDNQISVITVSRSGDYVASGQRTYMGCQADIIIWDFKERSMIHRLKLHKVQIQSLSFSYNELYLASLGGIDDKNMLIVWDINRNKIHYPKDFQTLQGYLKNVQLRFFKKPFHNSNSCQFIIRTHLRFFSIQFIQNQFHIQFIVIWRQICLEVSLKFQRRNHLRITQPRVYCFLCLHQKFNFLISILIFEMPLIRYSNQIIQLQDKFAFYLFTQIRDRFKIQMLFFQLILPLVFQLKSLQI